MIEHQIVTFSPRWLEDFSRLNVEWIEKYFKIEEMDRAQLSRAEELIIQPGGEIFFIIQNDHAIATCAMVKHGDGYELAKMAVSPHAQGQGLGHVLMKTAIDWARSKNAHHIMLLSNTILIPAIELYKKHGFVIKHLGPHPDYERSNIEMMLDLTN